MFDVSTNVRMPAFLQGVNVDRKVGSAGFLDEHRRAMTGIAANDVQPLDMTAPSGGTAAIDQLIDMSRPGAVAAGAAGLAAPAAAAPAPAHPPIDMSRLDAAVDRLRLLSDRLASDARSDALELGLMIARKVVEGELSVNADRLISVVKSAVSKVGESRRITVRLAPEDAAMMTGASAPKKLSSDGGGSDPGATTDLAVAAPASPSPLERIGRGAAKIEVIADPSLSRGDCMVEGDHLSVDATLNAKFAEIRRSLMESAWEDGA
jgi:hypothetical protein